MTGDLNAFEDEPEVTRLTEVTSLGTLRDEVPPPLAYSFQFQGKLQTLDHLLVSDGLRDRLDAITYAHVSTDYFLRSGVEDDGHSASDHDPPIAAVFTGPLCDGARPTILGSSGRDLLVGTAARDVVWAGGGDDLVLAGWGDDTVCGDVGNDLLFGVRDHDVMLGGGGNDVLIGHGGRDLLDAGLGYDVCLGGDRRIRCERPR